MDFLDSIMLHGIKINLINKELCEICNWFKANKLSANASKTNYMVLGTSQSTNKYMYENVDSSGDDIYQ